MLDHSHLLRELRGLERKRGTAGRDRVDHRLVAKAAAARPDTGRPWLDRENPYAEVLPDPGPGWLVKDRDGAVVAHLSAFFELIDTTSERLARQWEEGFVVLMEGTEELSSWEARFAPDEMDYLDLRSALPDLDLILVLDEEQHYVPPRPLRQ